MPGSQCKHNSKQTVKGLSPSAGRHSEDNEDEEGVKASVAARRGISAALFKIQAQSACY